MNQSESKRSRKKAFSSGSESETPTAKKSTITRFFTKQDKQTPRINMSSDGLIQRIDEMSDRDIF